MTKRKVHGGFTGPKSRYWFPAWSQTEWDRFSGCCGLVLFILIGVVALIGHHR